MIDKPTTVIGLRKMAFSVSALKWSNNGLTLVCGLDVNGVKAASKTTADKHCVIIISYIPTCTKGPF